MKKIFFTIKDENNNGKDPKKAIVQEKRVLRSTANKNEEVTIIRPLHYKTKRLIFLLIEDTKMMSENIKYASALINKIVVPSSEVIVCPIEFSSEVKVYKLEEFRSTFKFNNTFNDACLSKAIDKVLDIAEKIYIDDRIFESCRIEEIAIRVIGTGNCEDVKKVSSILKKMEQMYKLNTVYYCLYDNQCIKPASMGFNIVTNLVKDFYS